MNMRPMEISAKILHSMWIVFLLHIVFLDGNADGFMILKGSKRAIQEEQTPQDFKRSLITRDLHLVKKKREFDETDSEPACQFRMDFVRLDRAHLGQTNARVRVNQDFPQYHLQYSCVNHHNSCTGIDSSRYFSRCEPFIAGESAWVYRRNPRGGWSTTSEYDVIKVEKACVCRLSRNTHH